MNKANELVSFLADLGVKASVAPDAVLVNRDDIESTFGADDLLAAVRDSFGKGWVWGYRDDNHFHLVSVY